MGQKSLIPFLNLAGNRSGFSIIEGLVGIAILALVIGLMAQSQFQMHRNYRGLAEASARDDFEKALIAAATDGGICKFELAGNLLSSTTWPTTFRIRGPGSPILFQIGKSLDPKTPSVIPTKFQVIKVSDLNANSALVNFVVSYNIKTELPQALIPDLVTPLKSSNVRVTVNLDGAGKIKDCSGTSDARDVCEKLGGTYNSAAAVKCNIPAYYQ